MEQPTNTTDGGNPAPLPSISSDPSVNGSNYLQSSSMSAPSNSAPGSTESHLIENPPRLGIIRQRLFEVDGQIELSLGDFQKYWPYVDNIWVKQRTTTSNQGHTTTEYYMCRLRRPTTKPKENRQTPEGKRSRKKQTREGGTCQMQLKVVKFEGVYSSCTITRMVSKEEKHSHDLDHIDKIKRNSVIMNAAKKEAVKGYLPSSIFAKLQEERASLEDAGGKYMTVTDVRNVQYPWRVENPDVQLRTHEGYEYQQGHGIVKVQEMLENQTLNGDFQVDGVPPIAPPQGASVPSNILYFPEKSAAFLQPYLPKHDENRKLPHVTLTYAQSMDSKISLAPGVQTALSGPETKAMTHYLRSKHDAILIGVGTALADDPGLNCRLEGAGGYGGLGWEWQPRPVIIDPLARWPIHPGTRLLKTVVEGKGKAPWVVISPGAYINPATHVMLKNYGGDYLKIMDYNPNWRLRWEGILQALGGAGIKSVMIEGGGRILSELLNPEYTEIIDSVIVTVAPTYLGSAGVTVSPDSKKDENGHLKSALRPREIKWQPMGEDVIMCGKVRTPPMPNLLEGIDLVAAEETVNSRETQQPV